jgi:hypothetical protein
MPREEVGKKLSSECFCRDAAVVGWKLPSAPPIDGVSGQQSMVDDGEDLQPRLHNVGTLTLQRQCKSPSHLDIFLCHMTINAASDFLIQSAKHSAISEKKQKPIPFFIVNDPAEN